jgi:hypothetical protein
MGSHGGDCCGMGFVRRGIVAGVTGALAMAMVGASPAAAGTVTASYRCMTAAGGLFSIAYRVTIDVPASANRGQTVTMNASIEQSRNYGAYLSANVYQATLDIILGGAASGTIQATGLTNPEIQPDTPWRLTGGTARTTFNTAGDVTYRPGRIHGGWWICELSDGSSPIAATTHVF